MAKPDKRPAATKVVVRTDAIFHDGKSYPYGAELRLPQDEARRLLREGRVAKA